MSSTDKLLAEAKRLHQAGELVRAVDLYRQVLASDETCYAAHYLLGGACFALNNVDEAIDHLEQAVRWEPEFVEGYNYLGALYGLRNRAAEAVAVLEQALKLDPQSPEIRRNLRRAEAAQHYCQGRGCEQQGHLEAAAECYTQAIRRDAEFVEAHNGLGMLHARGGRYEQAATYFRHALVLMPDFVAAHFNLGHTLLQLGRRDETLACYRRAVELDPDFQPALCGLVHEMQHLCDWNGLDELAARLRRSLSAASASAGAVVPPFNVLALPLATTPSEQLHAAKLWVQGHPEWRPAEAAPRSRVDHKDRLSVGYLSADFCTHAVASLAVELFERHDRQKFEVVAYSTGRDDGSPMRRRLEAAFDRFVDLQQVPSAAAVDRIAADGIDILVDLNGYTIGSRTEILASRPAPIQINYLGYPGTMGAPFIDYILVDDFIAPPQDQSCFSEKLVHLPGCYQANDSRREIAPRAWSRAECGLPEEGLVFGAFNHPYKITPDMFDAWMRLLAQVPGSVLWLFAANRFVAANLRREAAARGVAPERLVFAEPVSLPEHLARYRLCDLLLDTLPYNAHTTASDALWVGCPVLTIAGQTFAARVAGSLLRTIGLKELITESLAEYEALALRLAQQPAQLAELKRRLQAHRDTCGLFDGGRFARHVEQAYETMWQIHTSGQQPRSFRVSPT